MKIKSEFRVWFFLTLVLSILTVTIIAPRSRAALPTIIHSFPPRDAANLEGAHPMDFLFAGGTFYGFTFAGGQFDNGVIFAINPDGSNFRLLHTFDGVDGQNPSHTQPLLLAGQTLYGINRAGFAYAINTDGSDYHHVHDFTANDDGYQPEGALTLQSDTLFGVTSQGSAGGNGTIFAVSTNGDNFRVIYSFSGFDDFLVQTNIDGAHPNTGVAIDGNVIYGATQFGGKRSGTIFKVNNDGTDFMVLHTFAPAAAPNQIASPNADGMYVEGKLILYSGKLYGVTRWGGSTANGVLFSLNTDGSEFKLLYTFPGQPDITVGDPGPLTLVGQSIYGTRPSGGANRQGFIFQYDINAAAFKTVYSFSALNSQSKNTDGNRPQSGVTVTDNKLYFTASGAGPSGTGTIGYVQFEVLSPTLQIQQTAQGLRILLRGQVGIPYTLEQTQTFPSVWLQPQTVTVSQDPEPIDLPTPSAPTFWRARYP